MAYLKLSNQMKKLFIGVVVMATTMLASCGQSFYPTNNHNLVTTNVNISEANFRVVGLVEGKAKATYVLGIGGLSSKALKSNAYADMVRNANLKGSQMVVNATISQTHYGFVPFTWTQTVKYQGTIIEFINPDQPATSVGYQLPKEQPNVNRVAESTNAPSKKKREENSSKKKNSPSVIKDEPKPIDDVAIKSIDKVDADKIRSMSKYRRESYLTDLIVRLNRLFGSEKSIDSNREEIDALMSEMKFILDNYDCRQSFHKSYKKYIDKLSK